MMEHLVFVIGGSTVRVFVHSLSVYSGLCLLHYRVQRNTPSNRYDHQNHRVESK